MAIYTAQHWGIYEVQAGEGAPPRLIPYGNDSDPSPIGLHQLDDGVARLRIHKPAVRKGWLDNGPGPASSRGAEPMVEVEWPTATALIAAEIDRVRSYHGNEAIFGGSYGWASAGRFHHAQSQLHRFLNCAGGYVRHVNSYSNGAGHVILPHVVAPLSEIQATMTSWDVLERDCELFVSFGGVPLKNTQVSAGGVSTHRVRGHLERMRERGTRFVNIDPVRDSLDGVADGDWLAIRPNTDVALMLGLAHELVSNGLHAPGFLARCTVGYETFERYLLGREDGVPKSATWAAAITGIDVGCIAKLARDMASNRTMINVAWALQRAAYGEQPYWMAVTLAAMLGQIGLPGGGFGIGYGSDNTRGSAFRRMKGPTLPQGRNPVSAFIPVARIADMLLNPGGRFRYDGGEYAYPDIRIVYWAGGNPFHHHQDLAKLNRAWGRPETIIVHEQYWTPTAKAADIVLPISTNLEREDIGFANLEGAIVHMPKAMTATGEARSDFEAFVDIARHLGIENAFTGGRSEAEWIALLFEEFREEARCNGVEVPPFDEFRRDGILTLPANEGGVVLLDTFREDPAANPLDTPSGRIEISSERIAGFGLEDCSGHPKWLDPVARLGSVERFPFHLISDQPAQRLHSQLDGSGFSQSGKRHGREQAELNTDDAHMLGIKDGDPIEISNDRGRCLASAILGSNIRRGVVRLSTGAWCAFDSEGRESRGNPNALTEDRGASDLSQGCAAQTCRVAVRRSADAVTVEPPFSLPAFAITEPSQTA